MKAFQFDRDFAHEGSTFETANEPALSPLRNLLVEIEVACVESIYENSLWMSPRSFIGTVVKTDEAAAKFLGKKVAVGRHQPCGECPLCRRGQTYACNQIDEDAPGGLATHVTASSRWALVLEDGLDGISPEQAALAASALGVAYSLYIETRVIPGDRVTVIGNGAIAKCAEALRGHFGVLEVKAPDSPHRILECTNTFAGRQAAIDAATPGSRMGWLQVNDGKSPDVSSLAPLGASLCWIRYVHPDLLTEILALVIKEEIALPAVEPVSISALKKSIGEKQQGESEISTHLVTFS